MLGSSRINPGALFFSYFPISFSAISSPYRGLKSSGVNFSPCKAIIEPELTKPIKATVKIRKTPDLGLSNVDKNNRHLNSSVSFSIWISLSDNSYIIILNDK